MNARALARDRVTKVARMTAICRTASGPGTTNWGTKATKKRMALGFRAVTT
jgi:hypothetical protein